MNEPVRQPVYVFAGFRLDAHRRILFGADGQPIALTPRVFDTLLYLVERTGHLVTKGELLTALWPNVVVEEHNLNKTVSELRRVLGEKPGEHRFIATKPGHGYRFVADVSLAPIATTESAARRTEGGMRSGPTDAEPTPPNAAAEPRRSAAHPSTTAERRAWHRPAAFAAVAAAAAVIAALWSLSHAPQPGRTPRPGSMAVLPFDNLSPDPDDSYLAVGIHEEILTQLTKIKALSVVSRTSVLHYADSSLSIPEIGDELNVGAILEGSVRFDTDRIRVSVQLVDAAADRRLWGETYEHKIEDIFGIQSDIATNVADALKTEFSAAERARIETAPTESVDAYALYLRSVQASRPAAIAYLEQAIATDPEFALAYATLAQRHAFELTNNNTVDSASPDERAAIEARVTAYAKSAIALDPDVPYAYTALAVPAHTSWRWTEAESALVRAIEVAPNDLTARNVYGSLLSALGRHDEALAIGRRAVELNPGNPNAAWYGYWLAAAGDFDEAAITIQRAIALNPTNLLDRSWLAFVEIARGNEEAAIAQLEFAERIAGTNRLVVFLVEWAYSYGRLGREADAQRIVREIESAANSGRAPGPGGWALAYLAIGDERRALESLKASAERAARHERDEGFYNVMNLKMDPTNDPRLQQPEFIRVLNTIEGD